MSTLKHTQLLFRARFIEGNVGLFTLAKTTTFSFDMFKSRGGHEEVTGYGVPC